MLPIHMQQGLSNQRSDGRTQSGGASERARFVRVQKRAGTISRSACMRLSRRSMIEEESKSQPTDDYGMQGCYVCWERLLTMRCHLSRSPHLSRSSIVFTFSVILGIPPILYSLLPSSSTTPLTLPSSHFFSLSLPPSLPPSSPKRPTK